MNRHPAARLTPRTVFDLAAVTTGTLLVFMAFTTGARGQAQTEYYRVYPGLYSSDLYQYGMHFDELAGPGYGARDFNRPGNVEAGQDVYHRVQLSKVHSPALVFRLTHEGSCGVRATAGWVSGGQFYAYAGERYHYIHMVNRQSNGALTPGVTAVDASVFEYVGEVASSGSCAGGGAHLHQSADLGPSTPIYRNIVAPSGETCWTNQSGTYAWQCWGTYKTHATSPDMNGGCGSYSGYSGSVTGLITGQYVCEEWSYVGQVSLAQWGSADKVFYVLGP